MTVDMAVRAPFIRLQGGAVVFVAVLAVFQALSYFDKQMFALLSTSIESSLKLSDIQLGILQGLAFSAPYSVSTLVYGWAADWFSPRVLLFCSVFLWSIAAASTGLGTTFAALFCARMVLGAGEAALQPCSYKIIARVTPSRQMATVVSFYTSGGVIGSALILTFGGAVINAITNAGSATFPLLGQLAPWQVAFFAMGFPGVFIAFSAFLLPRLPGRSSTTQNDVVVREQITLAAFFVQHRGLILGYYSILALLGICLFAVMAWTPTFLIRIYHLSYREVGLVMGLGTGAGAIAGILWGVVTDALRRCGVVNAPYQLFFWLALTGTPCGIAAFLSHSVVLFIVFFCLNSMLLGAFSALAATLQLFAPIHLIGRLYGLQAFILGSLGAGLAPLLVAFLTQTVFGDGALVGRALSITIAVCGTLACVLLALGAKPLTKAINTSRVI